MNALLTTAIRQQHGDGFPARPEVESRLFCDSRSESSKELVVASGGARCAA